MYNVNLCARLAVAIVSAILIAGCVDGTLRVKLTDRSPSDIPSPESIKYKVNIIENALMPNLYKIEVDLSGWGSGSTFRHWDHAMRHSAHMAKTAGFSHFLFKNFGATINERIRISNAGKSSSYSMEKMWVIVEFHNSPQGLVTLRYDVDRILAETAALPDPHSIKRHGQVTMPIAVPSPG